MMLSRMVFILLMLWVVLGSVISESRKYKIDGLLRTMASADRTGSRFHVKETKTKSMKLKSTICKLPLELGPCPDAKQRYYYDSLVNECKIFTYGGCRGNKNNFRSLDKCQRTCKT